MATKERLEKTLHSTADGYIGEFTFKLRELLVNDILRFLTTEKQVAKYSGHLRPVKGKRALRDYSCIAPRCRHRSKGPRFQYLCAKHLAEVEELRTKKGKRRDGVAWRAVAEQMVAAWRKARR